MKAKGPPPPKKKPSDKRILVTGKQNRENFTFVAMVIGQAQFIYIM